MEVIHLQIRRVKQGAPQPLSGSPVTNEQAVGVMDLAAPLTNRTGRVLAVIEHAGERRNPDRKSTRLNSSHVRISYAVFCLKKKKKTTLHTTNNTRQTPT